MNTIEFLSPREAYAAHIMGSLIVDVRDAKDVATQRVGVNQFLNIPFSDLDARLGEIPQSKQVVFVSRVGVKGKAAAKMAAERGYLAANIDGGLTAWQADGFPVQ